MHSVSEFERKRQPVGQLVAQLEVIVDFAVVGDRRRARRQHRLLRGLAQIDDRQAAVGEPDGACRARSRHHFRPGRDGR